MATLPMTVDAAEAACVELEAWIKATQRKSLLRFITCGSVDDGKSTLIGRLLYDSRQLSEDQLSALASESKRQGTQGDALDFALLVDGLSAEREQGITIDVAYRFFATDKRKFIVADTPGHEQYTRNMVTGASTADVAVILIDARKGVLTQTRRHTYLAYLLGARHLVLAVNKMDLVRYEQAIFDAIIADYRAFADEMGIEAFTAIPLSGLRGDNVVAASDAMPWYNGPTLLDHLETVPAAERAPTDEPFRMAVQWVNRPDQHFRGYAGRIASGRVRVGDEVIVLPASRPTTISRIVTRDGDLSHAIAGQSVTLTFTDEIDCSRGDLVAGAKAAHEPVSRIEATLVWMSDERLVPHRSYWLKVGTRTVSASVDTIKSVIDVNTLEQGVGSGLGLNDIGRVELQLDRAVPALRYVENRQLGGFILIDKLTHATVASGLVEGFPTNPVKVSGGHDPARNISWVLGKSRAAWAATEMERLNALGRRAFVVDEAALSGFAAEDPIRTARELARLMARAGVDVLITIEVDAAEAHPGRIIDADYIGDGGDAWVI